MKRTVQLLATKMKNTFLRVPAFWSSLGAK